ncbi:MAG: hypothetical protein JW709_00605 [Sedimentisphaerales bacterium]|nr:hypothetical protein [Sedimentisphaerales bacterium]
MMAIMTYNEQARTVQRKQGPSRTTATVVLGGILIAGVLGAYLFVLKNAGLDQAWEDGLTLLEEISDKGLDSYLGRTPRRQYYLLEEDGQTIGFAVAVLEPKLEEDNRLFYLGRNLIYQHGDEDHEVMEHEGAFRVANDLKTFESNTLVRDTNGGMLEQMAYREGELQVRLRDSLGRQQQLIVPRREDTILVCPGMEDIISSISLSQNFSHGVSFELPMIHLTGKGPQVVFQQCWVMESNEASPDMIASDSGRAAKARWYVHNILNNVQQLYYDEEHQLLWQRDDVDPPRIRRAVTREKLLEVIPEAQRVLRRWFDTERDTMDKQKTGASAGDYL